MNNFAILLALLGGVFFWDALQAAPAQRTPSYRDDNTLLIKETQSSVESIKHQVNNHESEIRMYDEKIANLETIIDSVRDQLNDATKMQRDQLKGTSATIDDKVAALDLAIKGLVSDVRQFKTHANDASVALVQYKQKIDSLEKIIDQQNLNIEHLQAAMKAMLEALSPKDSASSKAIGASLANDGSYLSYQVKAGDSLEKIARAHQTTIQIIKEMNGITNDKIIVGKTLKIPVSSP